MLRSSRFFSLHVCLQGPSPVTQCMRHLVKRAQHRHGRAWRRHVLDTAKQLFNQKVSSTLSCKQLGAGRRALCQLQGFLNHLEDAADNSKAFDRSKACESAPALGDPTCGPKRGSGSVSGGISVVLRACAERQPQRSGLVRGVCERVERDGELLNAAMDSTTGLQFLLNELAAWLQGALQFNLHGACFDRRCACVTFVWQCSRACLKLHLGCMSGSQNCTYVCQRCYCHVPNQEQRL